MYIRLIDRISRSSLVVEERCCGVPVTLNRLAVLCNETLKFDPEGVIAPLLFRDRARSELS
jgi:hypothetical protein